MNKDKLEPFQVARYSVGVFYEVATKALAQTKFPHVFGSDAVIEQHSNTKGPKLQDHLSTPDIHGAHFGTPSNMDGLGSKSFADQKVGTVSSCFGGVPQESRATFWVRWLVESRSAPNAPKPSKSSFMILIRQKDNRKRKNRKCKI